MRQKQGRTAAVYNVVVHINGDIGQLFTGAVGGVKAKGNEIEQTIERNMGTVASRDITNKATPLQELIRLVASELERDRVS